MDQSRSADRAATESLKDAMKLIESDIESYSDLYVHALQKFIEKQGASSMLNSVRSGNIGLVQAEYEIFVQGMQDKKHPPLRMLPPAEFALRAMIQFLHLAPRFGQDLDQTPHLNRILIKQPRSHKKKLQLIYHSLLKKYETRDLTLIAKECLELFLTYSHTTTSPVTRGEVESSRQQKKFSPIKSQCMDSRSPENELPLLPHPTPAPFLRFSDVAKNLPISSEPSPRGVFQDCCLPYQFTIKKN